MLLEDLTGKSFVNLVVLSQGPNSKSRQTQWRCQCKCGVELLVRASNLKSGNSTGCRRCQKRPHKLPPGTAASNALHHAYSRDAVVRGYEWKLTRESFDAKIKSCCHYCGLPPSQIKVNGTDRVTYTGIDRRNPSLGYTEENCVPCCKHCNFAKLKMTEIEFRSFVARVYHHMYGA